MFVVRCGFFHLINTKDASFFDKTVVGAWELDMSSPLAAKREATKLAREAHGYFRNAAHPRWRVHGPRLDGSFLAVKEFDEWTTDVPDSKDAQFRTAAINILWHPSNPNISDEYDKEKIENG